MLNLLLTIVLQYIYINTMIYQYLESIYQIFTALVFHGAHHSSMTLEVNQGS